MSKVPLGTIPNRYAGAYTIEIHSRDLSSLCPVDGKPDYYDIKIVYVPDEKAVELNSLREYLFGFYNEVISHEDKLNEIYERLRNALFPVYLRVELALFSREGVQVKLWREGHKEN